MKTIPWLLTAALILIASGGCATVPMPVDPAASMYGGDPADPAGAEAPFAAPDPLTGEAPAPASDHGPSQHQGHDHGMPAGGTSADGTPAGDAAYVCPMHPEQTSSEPGTCPICGMELVPVEGEP